jgi:hypothetical protein
MRASPVISEPQVLIFDTGPLWELVLYSAVRTLEFGSLEPELTYLRTHSAYQRLTDFVDFFPRKTTTSHVVAEISSKVIRTERKGRSAIWGLVYGEFSSMRMDERLLKLLEMPQSRVADMGATDVGVLQLAMGFATQKAVVISIDEQLIAQCKTARVDAQHIRDVILY